MSLNTINISIRDLSKHYHTSIGINHVSTDLENGALHLVTGKNGSGKTTFIKCIMQHLSYKGTITKKKYRIGYAPENYVMPGFMTVYEFLVSIGRIKHLYKPYLDIDLERYLSLFSLKDKLFKPIRALSNGMKQKLNITQALLNHPKIIILDEPLVGLDFHAQKQLVKILIHLSKERLVIISTHFPEKFNTKKKEIHHFDQGKLI